MSVVNYSELDYKRPKKDKYLFPTWAVGIGWGMASLSAIWIPIVIIYRLAKNGVSGEVRISKLLGWGWVLGGGGVWPPSRQYGSPSLSSTDWQRTELVERYVSVNPWGGDGPWGLGEGLLGWGSAVGIGWGMASLSAIWIPIVIIYRLAKNGVSGEVSISKLLGWGWALGIGWGSWGDGPWGLGGHVLPLSNMDPHRYHLQTRKERSKRRGTHQLTRWSWRGEGDYYLQPCK